MVCQFGVRGLTWFKDFQIGISWLEMNSRHTSDEICSDDVISIPQIPNAHTVIALYYECLISLLEKISN